MKKADQVRIRDSVWCPYCGAEPGQDCIGRSKGGTRYSLEGISFITGRLVHKSRMNEYYDSQADLKVS